MAFRFYKYEGLGNDFIVVERSDLKGFDLGPEQARELCDRHLGIGADGVLIVDHRGSRSSMEVINADGSIPEMCGNGLRCVCLHLVRRKLQSEGSFEVDTASGAHASSVEGRGDIAMVAVHMRAPSLEPRDVPVQASKPWIDETIDVGDRSLRFTAVSMGNPHIVTFDEVGDARFAIAPQLQDDPRLPQGANVGFADLVNDTEVELHVFERGAGWTQACGTGACAAAMAAVVTERSPRSEPIRVRLPGGDLEITVGESDQPVLMKGPARFVFEGRTGS